MKSFLTYVFMVWLMLLIIASLVFFAMGWIVAWLYPIAWIYWFINMFIILPVSVYIFLRLTD